ncbi:MAG TPA: nucleoside deaminase [Pyrinomonadaceae bacterium]|nr:nucleoside deaminase [Pyrinomonadaceae bacterium]
MDRRTVLHSLFSSIVAAPILGATNLTKAVEAFPTSSTIADAADERYMRRAIQLAANNPKYPFAALLVNSKKDVAVAEGWNRSAQNPTWHGEMDAINKCAAFDPKVDWTVLTLYTTAEPCAMCQGAVAWSGISRVVFGSSIPFLKSLDWWAIDIRAAEVARLSAFRTCTVVGGVLEEECNQLFRKALTVK